MNKIVKKYIEFKIFKESERQKGFDKLERKLLNKSGNSVKYTYEEDLDKLLEDGDFYLSDDYDDVNVVTIEMSPSKCHRNCVEFYKNFIENHSEEEIDIVTGWALNDGTWVQHSWIFFSFDWEIIETTSVKRDMYYGIILKGKEVDDFLFNNE